MLRLICLSAVIFIVSCSSPKKLKKLMDKYPEETAKQCSEKFPIKETIDTFYTVDYNLLGAYENEYFRLNNKIDSLLGEGCDTVVIDSIKTIIKQLPAKTNTKVIVKTQESTAKLQVAKDSCDKLINGLVAVNNNNATLITNLTDSNGKLKTHNKWLWLVLIVSVAWNFRRRIVSLAKSFV